jgi:hypothetical protein
VSDLRLRLRKLAPDAPPLQQLCAGAVELLGVTGVAVILMSKEETGATVVASNDAVRTIEELQFTLGEGPCLQAFQSGAPVLEAELRHASASDWPEFSRQAQDAGARAVFALPLRLGAIRIGVLYLYRAEPGMLTDDQLGDGFALADLASELLLETQAYAPEGELGSELAGGWALRAVVHQAVGMIAAQLDIDLGEALARLRAHAYGNGGKVYDVALDVVERRIRF